MAGSLRRETELQCSGQRFYFSGDFFKNNFSFKRNKDRVGEGGGKGRKEERKREREREKKEIEEREEESPKRAQ